MRTQQRMRSRTVSSRTWSSASSCARRVSRSPAAASGPADEAVTGARLSTRRLLQEASGKPFMWRDARSGGASGRLSDGVVAADPQVSPNQRTLEGQQQLAQAAVRSLVTAFHTVGDE